MTEITRTYARKRTRHGLHLVLTLCTFGLWAFTGWPIAWAMNAWGPRAKQTTITSTTPTPPWMNAAR